MVDPVLRESVASCASRLSVPEKSRSTSVAAETGADVASKIEIPQIAAVRCLIRELELRHACVLLKKLADFRTDFWMLFLTILVETPTGQGIFPMGYLPY